MKSLITLLIYLAVIYRFSFNCIMPYYTVWKRKAHNEYEWSADTLLDIFLMILVLLFNISLFFFNMMDYFYEKYIFLISLSLMVLSYINAYIVSYMHDK